MAIETTHVKSEELTEGLTKILNVGSPLQPMLVQIMAILPFKFITSDNIVNDSSSLYREGQITEYKIVWQAQPLPMGMRPQ